MAETVRYAWWKAPVNALGGPFPVPVRTYAVVPGMGQWVQLWLAEPMRLTDLPKGVIPCEAMQVELARMVAAA